MGMRVPGGALVLTLGSLVLLGVSALAVGQDPVVTDADTIELGDPCDAFSIYVPGPDVAYQPGVDVEGNPVVPADDESSSPPLLGPDHEYRVDLTLPLGDAVETPPGSGAERVKDSDLAIGNVTVRDGRIYFNGQPLDDESEHALAVACARRQAQGRIEP
jgi:hypothetical protein